MSTIGRSGYNWPSTASGKSVRRVRPVGNTRETIYLNTGRNIYGPNVGPALGNDTKQQSGYINKHSDAQRTVAPTSIASNRIQNNLPDLLEENTENREQIYEWNRQQNGTEDYRQPRAWIDESPTTSNERTAPGDRTQPELNGRIQNQTREDTRDDVEESEQTKQKQSDPDYDDSKAVKTWYLQWKVSTDPRLSFQTNSSRTIARARLTANGVAVTDGTDDPTLQTSVHARSRDITTNDNDRAPLLNVVSGNREAPGHSTSSSVPSGISKITSATFYKNNVVIYDQGRGEVIMYNADLTAVSHYPEKDVQTLAVLNDVLFITGPKYGCMDAINLKTMTLRESIAVPKVCHSLCRFDNVIAILLSDKDDQDFFVTFFDSFGFIDCTIPVSERREGMNWPNDIAMCSITQQLYVSGMGMVKCFRTDGELLWQKDIYDAGSVCTYHGYLLLSREYNSSIDVLTPAGLSNGRLMVSEYDSFTPSVIAVQKDTGDVLVVDDTQMLHVFSIESVVVEVIHDKKCSSVCTIS